MKTIFDNATRDLNDVIQVAAKIPGARIGSIEVRPVMESPDQKSKGDR